MVPWMTWPSETAPIKPSWDTASGRSPDSSAISREATASVSAPLSAYGNEVGTVIAYRPAGVEGPPGPSVLPASRGLLGPGAAWVAGPSTGRAPFRMSRPRGPDAGLGADT